MTIHIWHIVGILICGLALLWANRKVVPAGMVQNIICVLIVLLMLFLGLASLGILPDMGVKISG